MGIRIMPYPSKTISFDSRVSIIYNGVYGYVCTVSFNMDDEKYIQEKEYRFDATGLISSNETFYIINNSPVVLNVHYYGGLDSGLKDKIIQPNTSDFFDTSGELSYDVGITPITGVPEIAQGPLTYIK